MRYGQLQNGTVVSVIEADTDPDAELGNWVPCGNAGPGFTTTNGVTFLPPVKMPDPRLWWLDVGPFKDRLGPDALAMAASTHDACKAVVEMLNGRKYVDVKDPKTINLLGLLMATGQPAANPMFAGSGPITALKISAITNTPTIDAERHIKGLG